MVIRSCVRAKEKKNCSSLSLSGCSVGTLRLCVGIWRRSHNVIIYRGTGKIIFHKNIAYRIRDFSHILWPRNAYEPRQTVVVRVRRFWFFLFFYVSSHHNITVRFVIDWYSAITARSVNDPAFENSSPT